MVTLDHGININIILSMIFFLIKIFAMPSTILQYLSPIVHNSEQSKFKILLYIGPHIHNIHLYK